MLRETCLALIIMMTPALAADVDDYFAMFQNTCAKSIASPEAFKKAASTAGARLGTSAFLRPNDDPLRDWNGVDLWKFGSKTSHMVLSMAMHGSKEKHSLDCALGAPGPVGINAEMAEQHIRAAFPIPKTPSHVKTNLMAGKTETDWVIGSGLDEKVISLIISQSTKGPTAWLDVRTQEQLP